MTNELQTKEAEKNQSEFWAEVIELQESISSTSSPIDTCGWE